MTSTTTTAGSDADRQAVLEPLARLYRAWEADDAETFVADYTEDASVIQPGVYKKDREEIRTTMAAGFAGPLNGSRVAAHPGGRPLSYRRHGHRGQRGRDHLPWAGRCRERAAGARDLGAGQARRRLAHRLLPQQPRQLRRRLPGTGRLPSEEPPRTRIRTFRVRNSVGAVVIARVKRCGPGPPNGRSLDDGAVRGLVLLRPGPAMGRSAGQGVHPRVHRVCPPGHRGRGHARRRSSAPGDHVDHHHRLGRQGRRRPGDRRPLRRGEGGLGRVLPAGGGRPRRGHRVGGADPGCLAGEDRASPGSAGHA